MVGQRHKYTTVEDTGYVEGIAYSKGSSTKENELSIDLLIPYMEYLNHHQL